MVKLATRYSSRAEQILFHQMLDRGISKGIIKSMNITHETSQVAREEIIKVFGRVSNQLEDGREYLCDGTDRKGFTAVDLTFAALAGPIVMPKEVSALYQDPKNMPDKLYSLYAEVRCTLAAKHCRKMYHKHGFGHFDPPRSSLKSCKGGKCSPITLRLVIPKQGGFRSFPSIGGTLLGVTVLGGLALMRSNL